MKIVKVNIQNILKCKQEEDLRKLIDKKLISLVTRCLSSCLWKPSTHERLWCDIIRLLKTHIKPPLHGESKMDAYLKYNHFKINYNKVKVLKTSFHIFKDFTQ